MMSVLDIDGLYANLSAEDTAAALDYARRGLLQPICEVRGLSRFAESVQQLRRSEVPGRIVIDFNKK